VSPESSEEDDVAAWAALLSRLEDDVRKAQAGEPLAPWHPPAHMPAMPHALVSRALAVLEAQAELRAAAEALRAELLRSMAQRRRAAHPGTARPVYVDALG
jgi:hypothetical protein